MESEPFILCENLVKIYRLDAGTGSAGDSNEVQALQGLDLTVARGEMIGVVGASGSGKSTLLNILGGLDRPTGGRAYVEKRDLGRLSQSELNRYRRETVGFVWQQGSRNLIPYLTAVENVQLPLIFSGRLDPAARRRSADTLAVVGLGDRASHRLEELSGGEQQRVAIAIALANQPRLLLADEPTGELDTATAEGIYGLLRELNRTLGLTVVIVSHDPGIASRVDRVVAVRDGKLASELVRKTSPGREGGPGSGEKHHLEELLILDSAGRLQIPREHLEQFKIRRRVRLEVTEDGILIRPPENEQAAPEAAVAGASGPGAPEPPPGWEELPEWKSAWRNPLRILKSVLRRRHAGEGKDRKKGSDPQ